ncbi:MAG: hypothetical protein ABIB71_08960 [Candidatus Woesearchaeota archaeon]
MDIRKQCIKLTKERLEESFNEEHEVIELIKLYDKTERFLLQIPEKNELRTAAKSSMKKNEQQINSILKKISHRLLESAGPIISARLIRNAGSLKKLSSMPSSKIQLLGAEKALFTHLKTGSKAPKHGIIFNHFSIKESENKGKAARKLASKIAIAARVDYFKKNKIT